ncbi:MAG TPA: AI-2E family transporter [Polyangiaceae bacterium]
MQSSDNDNSSEPSQERRGVSARLPAWLVLAGDASWRLLVVGALVYFGFRALLYFHIVLLPLVLALFIAALLEPVVTRLERLLPRSLAALTALLLGLGLLVAGFVFLGVRVAAQVKQASDFVDRGLTQLVSLFRSTPFDGNLEQPADIAASMAKWLSSRGAGIASSVATGTMAVFIVGSQILLTLAFSFFIMRDGPRLFDRYIGRLNDRGEERVRHMATSAWETLGRYLRGLSLIALANSLLKGLALLILGIPMILPIMVLTFLGSFIPFAGPIIAGAVAALVALAHSGPTDALLVVAAALLIQIVEGNVLQPFILGKTMHLQPLMILAAVASGAIVAGLAGAFLAVPVLAAGKTALGVWKRERAAEA